MKYTRLQLFFIGLGCLCAVIGLACIPFAPGVFGVLFFGGLAAGCLLEAFLLRRQDCKLCRILSRIGLTLFTVFVLSFAAIQGVIQHGMTEDDVQADYVFVLGARVYQSGNPSLTLAKRLDRTKQYLDENPNSIAILCGGQGSNEPMPEAVAMRNYLVAAGIDDTRLILESESRNTIQNIENGKALLDEISDTYTTVVISSDFHCARARRLMIRAGLAGDAIPAETPRLSQRIMMRCREYCSILGLMVTFRW